jgi:hypothetical protein
MITPSEFAKPLIAFPKFLRFSSPNLGEGNDVAERL